MRYQYRYVWTMYVWTYQKKRVFSKWSTIIFNNLESWLHKSGSKVRLYMYKSAYTEKIWLWPCDCMNLLLLSMFSSPHCIGGGVFEALKGTGWHSSRFYLILSKYYETLLHMAAFGDQSFCPSGMGGHVKRSTSKHHGQCNIILSYTANVLSVESTDECLQTKSENNKQ